MPATRLPVRASGLALVGSTASDLAANISKTLLRSLAGLLSGLGEREVADGEGARCDGEAERRGSARGEGESVGGSRCVVVVLAGREMLVVDDGSTAVSTTGLVLARFVRGGDSGSASGASSRSCLGGDRDAFRAGPGAGAASVGLAGDGLRVVRTGAADELAAATDRARFGVDGSVEVARLRVVVGEMLALVLRAGRARATAPSERRTTVSSHSTALAAPAAGC